MVACGDVLDISINYVMRAFTRIFTRQLQALLEVSDYLLNCYFACNNASIRLYGCFLSVFSGCHDAK